MSTYTPTLSRFPVARAETTEDILQRCLALCPELVPPDIRAERSGTVEDLRPLIVGVGCGFRPAREGGIRLESEWVQRSSGYAAGKGLVVYNYGCVASTIELRRRLTWAIPIQAFRKGLRDFLGLRRCCDRYARNRLFRELMRYLTPDE